MGGETDFVKDLVASKPVVVFSKSYCPHCTKAKKSLAAIGAKYEVLELDQMGNGSAIQDALVEITGQRTVPNVFVAGSSIGGGDDTVRLHKSGQLATMITNAGAA
ncbi:unnamed protein product [Sphacelaria rigidula]